jgi:arylsulfatase A
LRQSKTIVFAGLIDTTIGYSMHIFSLSILLSLVLAASANAARNPNIVLILADDLGYADVSFGGRREWATPNLNRLALDGTVFRRWYTASVVCAPSRAALMTGRYGIHNGVTGNGSLDLPSEELTIAEALKSRGYATALFGKWHHGGARPGSKAYTHPMDQGFDEFFGFTEAKHAWEKFPTKLWDGRELNPSEGYADTLFTDRALEFIKRHKGDPFFLYLPFIAPHGIPGAPADEIEALKGKFREKDPAKPNNSAYAAQLIRMDKDIGRIIKLLDALDLNKDTIIIFTSDHGATFEPLAGGAPLYFDSNRPFRGQKRTLWEGGLRVPAVVRWTGHVPARGDSHEVVHMCDVFPTLLAAAGGEVDPNWKIDGANVLDLWQGKAKSPDRTLYWEWREGGNIQYAAMKRDLKMVITGGNEPELFNIEHDPIERRTLAAEFPDELKAMQKGVQEWLATESEASKQRRRERTSAPATAD